MKIFLFEIQPESGANGNATAIDAETAQIDIVIIIHNRSVITTTAEEVILDDEDMLRMLTEGVKINGYRLSSTTFRMKGQHIPAFTGTLRFHVRLAAPIQTIWNALLLFGAYSGVGIKTALGMGGMTM